MVSDEEGIVGDEVVVFSGAGFGVVVEENEVGRSDDDPRGVSVVEADDGEAGADVVGGVGRLVVA